MFFLSSFAKTLVLTPLMLVAWGETGFSFWAIILSARAVVLFLTDAYVRYVANRYNLVFHKDEAKAAALLSAGVSFLLFVSALLCLLAGIALWLVPELSALLFAVGAADALSAGLPLCLLAYLCAACVQNIQRMLAASQEARGLVARNMMFEVLLVMLELAVMAVLLSKGHSLYTGVLTDSLLIAAAAGGYLFYLLRRYPLSGLLNRQSIQVGAGAFVKAGKLYAGNFFEKLCTDGLVLLLSFFRFDKAAIALFATVRTMVNAPVLAQNLLLNTYTPLLQKRFALRDEAGLKALFRLVRLQLGSIMMLGIVCCYPLYEPVFVYWTKGRLSYSAPFMISMLLLTVFNLYGTGFLFVLKGLNQLPELLRLMLWRTLLVLAAFFCAAADPVQLGVLLAVAELLCSVVYLPLVLRGFWRREGLYFRYTSDIIALLPYLLAVLCLLVIACLPFLSSGLDGR